MPAGKTVKVMLHPEETPVKVAAGAAQLQQSQVQGQAQVQPLAPRISSGTVVLSLVAPPVANTVNSLTLNNTNTIVSSSLNNSATLTLANGTGNPTAVTVGNNVVSADAVGGNTVNLNNSKVTVNGGTLNLNGTPVNTNAITAMSFTIVSTPVAAKPVEAVKPVIQVSKAQ